MGGDRVPIVLASQGVLIEAMRTYTIALVSAVLCEGRLTSPASATTAVLVALANGGGDEAVTLGELKDTPQAPPLHSLLDTDVSMFEGALDGQDKPYWAMLRVVLSGKGRADAEKLALALINAENLAPGVGAACAMLCALMHTRMGMLIFGYTEDGGESYPIADLAAFTASAPRGASVLDLALGAVGGTLDLREMASSGEDEACATEAALVVERFGALRHVAQRWIVALEDGKAWPCRRARCPACGR